MPVEHLRRRMAQHAGHPQGILSRGEHERCERVARLVHRAPPEAAPVERGIPDPVSQVVHVQWSTLGTDEDVECTGRGYVPMSF